MQPKIVKEFMTPHPGMINPDNTIKAAAKKMKELDCGMLPVGDSDKPIGIITDRDVVIYGIAEGKNPETTQVEEIMTEELIFCFEDDTLEKAADKMNTSGVRRLVVLNDQDRIVGILSTADIVSNLGGEDHVSDEVLHHLYRCA